MNLPEIDSALVSVLITCYNTDAAHLEDLVIGLNNQVLRPKEIVFVDDGSDEVHRKHLITILQGSLKVPYRIIHLDTNQGHGVARNRGLAEVTTKYLVALDSDNIVLPEAIFEGVYYLEAK